MNTQFLIETARDTVLWAGVGYCIGHIAQTSPETVAVVFAISTVAQHLFKLWDVYAHQNNPNGLQRARDIRYSQHTSAMIITCITAVVLDRMRMISTQGAVWLAMGSCIYHMMLASQ